MMKLEMKCCNMILTEKHKNISIIIWEIGNMNISHTDESKTDNRIS